MAGLELLRALAEIGDVKDVRVRSLMARVGLDRPVLFYRRLVQEARQVMGALQEGDRLRSRVAGLQGRGEEVEQEKAELQQEAAAASLAWQAELNAVKADKARLEEENRRLADMVYPAQWRYEGVKEFLSGGKDIDTLKAMRDLFSDLVLDALEEKEAALAMQLYTEQAGIEVRWTRSKRRSDFDLALLRAAIRDDLLAAVEHPPDEVAELRRALEELLVFKDIPCCRCGKPMTGWRREQVLQAFATWHHVQCPPR